MPKPVKTVLFITDDLDSTIGMDEAEDFKRCIDSGFYYGHEESNWLTFNMTIVTSFDEAVKIDHGFDVALIDYGLVGDTSLENLREIKRMNPRTAWVGGLDGDMIEEDLVKMFPRVRFLKNWPSCMIGRDEVLFLLYQIFKSEEPKKDGLK